MVPLGLVNTADVLVLRLCHAVRPPRVRARLHRVPGFARPRPSLSGHARVPAFSFAWTRALACRRGCRVSPGSRVRLQLGKGGSGLRACDDRCDIRAARTWPGKVARSSRETERDTVAPRPGRAVRRRRVNLRPYGGAKDTSSMSPPRQRRRSLRERSSQCAARLETGERAAQTKRPSLNGIPSSVVASRSNPLD